MSLPKNFLWFFSLKGGATFSAWFTIILTPFAIFAIIYDFGQTLNYTNYEIKTFMVKDGESVEDFRTYALTSFIFKMAIFLTIWIPAIKFVNAIEEKNHKKMIPFVLVNYIGFILTSLIFLAGWITASYKFNWSNKRDMKAAMILGTYASISFYTTRSIHAYYVQAKTENSSINSENVIPTVAICKNCQLPPSYDCLESIQNKV